MDFELDFGSENSTMTSFLELEQEIREAPLLSEPLVRPSVIVKPRHKPTVQPSLSDIMDSCGIEYDLPGDCNANISSPSSIHSDVQLEQNRELIDELEEFFINTDGKPTVVDDCEELILDDQYSPAGSGLVTADGQNVITSLRRVLRLRASLLLCRTRPTLTPSGAHHLPVQASGVSWPARQSRPSRGRSTPGPSHQPRLLPRPILLTRRRGRRLRTGPPPSGTGRKRKVSWTWPRKSSRLWRTRTLA